MRKLKAGDKVRWMDETTVRTLLRPCSEFNDSWYIDEVYSSCCEEYLTLAESAKETEKPVYKAGQKVRVIANTNSHGYKIGQTIELKRLPEARESVDSYDGVERWFSSTFADGETWFVSVNDIEPIKEEIAPEKPEALSHVTTSTLDIALRACGIHLPYEIVDNMIDLAELIQATKGEATLKDIAELQAEWKK